MLTTPAALMGASDRLALDSMTEDQRVWMASLPLTRQVVPGVLAFHGSPTDDLVYLLETVEPTGVRPATETEVTERLGPAAAGDWSLILCGHTHLQRQMRLHSGTLVVNPGSVGYPAFADDRPHPHVVETGSPHARYSIVDDAEGGWHVEFRAIEYDWERAARAAERHGRPDIARGLRTGRA